MSRRCSICSHPRRAAIDRALVGQGGGTLRDIGTTHGVSKSALHRHKRDCLRDELAEARAEALAPVVQLVTEEAAEQGRTIVERVESLERRAEKLLDLADARARDDGASSRDLNAAAGLVRELRHTLGLLAQLSGELREIHDHHHEHTHVETPEQRRHDAQLVAIELAKLIVSGELAPPRELVEAVGVVAPRKATSVESAESAPGKLSSVESKP